MDLLKTVKVDELYPFIEINVRLRIYQREQDTSFPHPHLACFLQPGIRDNRRRNYKYYKNFLIIVFFISFNVLKFA